MGVKQSIEKAEEKERHPLFQLVSQKPDKHLRKFVKGVECATEGVKATFKNPELVEAEKRLIKVIFWEFLRMYGGVVLLMLVFWPVTATVFFASPGTIINVFQMAPIVALNLLKSNAKNEALFKDVFYTELRMIDEPLCEELEAQMRENKRRSLYSKLRLSYHFAFWSAVANVLGLLPGGSIISTFAQGILVAESYSHRILEPYLNTLKGYSAKQQFLRKNYFVLLGYSLPMVLLNMVPILNIYAIAHAQAGAAHLLRHCVSQQHDTSGKRSSTKRTSSKRTSKREEQHEEATEKLDEDDPDVNSGEDADQAKQE